MKDKMQGANEPPLWIAGLAICIAIIGPLILLALSHSYPI
jgi:hypothetical protein